MATVELTRDNFDQTVAGNPMVILFQQAGALPASALEQVIAQAEALDMAKVQQEIEASRQA